MASNEIKYTQSVWGYQEVKRKFWLEGKNRVLGLYLRPPDAHCPKCRSRNVRAHRRRDRTLIGLPNGKCQVRFGVPVRKVVCRDCRAVTYERVAFAAYKNARITRLLAKKLLERAADVSMKSLAEEYRISWRTVRDAIENGLRKRYRRRDYSKVENIGVDELHVFRNERPSRRFITTVRDQDSKAVDRVKRDLLALYRKGIRKHAKKYAFRVERIYDTIAGQLSRHEKDFRFSSLGENARFREYESAFLWLSDAMVVNIALNVTDPHAGFGLNADDSKMKCYFLDTGLLVSHAFNENALATEDIHNRILFDDVELNEGMLVENVVAQMLTAAGQKLYFYSNRDREGSASRMEIDFLLSRSKLEETHNAIPVEVKSGVRISHRSLDKFMAKYADYVAESCLLSVHDLKVKDGITYLPLYMTPLLPSMAVASE